MRDGFLADHASGSGAAARRASRSKADILATVMALVARAFKVQREALYAPTRGPAEIARARQVGVYLAHVEAGLSLSDIGRQLGRDRTTVGHACRLVEDLRDDALFDTTLTMLGRAVRALRCGAPA